MTKHTASRFASLTFAFALIVSTAFAQPSASAADEFTAFTIPVERVATLSHSEWKDYSGRLFDAFESDNAGVRAAAMRAMIQYGENVQFNRAAVLELTRTYRDEQDSNTRRMAVVALAATDDAWAIDFLTRSLAYETDQSVKHTVASVLIEKGAIGFGPARSGN